MALVITRKNGETFLIADDIKVTISAVGSGQVRLAMINKTPGFFLKFQIIFFIAKLLFSVVGYNKEFTGHK